MFALVGVILLAVARLPLYRQRRFFAFGPAPLDLAHRRLYWRGYGFILVGIFFLAVVLALPAGDANHLTMRCSQPLAGVRSKFP